MIPTIAGEPVAPVDLWAWHQLKKLSHNSVIVARYAGAEGWDDIEVWGIENEAMLRGYLRLRNGIPGHNTIRQVFEVSEPKEVGMRFADRVTHICPALKGRVIAIDARRRGGLAIHRPVE